MSEGQHEAPIRLLFATAEPHPSFRADVRVLFGNYLPRHGLHSDLLAQALPGSTDSGWPAGRTWLTPRSGRALTRLWAQFRHDLRLFALARQGYDAVQVRDRVLAGAIGLLAARRAGLPFFYWASYPKPEARLLATRIEGVRFRGLAWLLNQIRGHLASWLLYRWLMPSADHVFVQSEAMKQSLVERGLPAERMTAVPMGVDLEEQAAPAQADPVWRERLAGREVVVYVGALETTRQPEQMLEAMALLRERRPQALLLLVGGCVHPRDMEALKARADELGLQQHVLFSGWLPSHEALVLASLGRVGLSVIPRGRLYDVSSPTKLAEYLSLGIPVVANDLPDQAAVLAASGGGICIAAGAGAMAEAMADAIERLLADPEAARASGERGRAYIAAERSYAVLSQRVAAVYREQLAAHRVLAKSSP